MKCPRCNSERITVDQWEFYYCKNCGYTWKDEVEDYDKYK
jgi:hypothetical protein